MIGLGSNRLSVCRRGGMSVTQAGRGGMEWLAGGRMPSWASPYSAQATAALKAQFPTQWPTIRDYGFAHPEIVPIVNKAPLTAPYIIVGDLAFMVDCQYECSAAKWTDLMQGIEFASNGNVTLQDGVPYFNGSAWYRYPQNLVYPHGDSTIEAIVEFNGYTNSWGCVFFQGNTSGLVFAIGQGTTAVYRIESQVGIGDVTRDVLQTIALNSTSKYKNGVIDNTSAGSYITLQAASDTRIGCRSDSNSCLIGKVYAIRIYNRLLTEQEILANQAIDLQRWQAS